MKPFIAAVLLLAFISIAYQFGFRRGYKSAYAAGYEAGGTAAMDALCGAVNSFFRTNGSAFRMQMIPSATTPMSH